MVSEREKGEMREPWKCVSLEIDGFDNLTPTELRDLGKWLMQPGQRSVPMRSSRMILTIKIGVSLRKVFQYIKQKMENSSPFQQSQLINILLIKS